MAHLHLHVSNVFGLGQCHTGFDLQTCLFGEEIRFDGVVGVVGRFAVKVQACRTN